MGKGVVDQIFFELFQRDRTAFKRIPGLTSGKYNPLYINPKYFWDQLQFVIGTKEDVQIRREVIELYVNAYRLSTCSEYISGSKGEGFLFYWSDLDIMISKLPPEVISMESFHNDCDYIATRNGCQPGFCKLIRWRECDYYSRIKFLHLIQHVGFNANFDQTNR